MKKFIKILLIVVVLLLVSILMSGCKDSKDINKKSIFTAVIADKKDDELFFYLETANIEGGSHKYIYAKNHGKTLPEARENLNRQLDKEPFLSGVRIILLTEDFAKEHLVEYLFRQRADELYRKRTTTVITKEDPEELLKINHDKNISLGYFVEDMLQTLEEAGQSFPITTTQILEELSSNYTGFLIPCIGLQYNKNLLIGYSVVKGTAISGFIPVEESKGILLIKVDKPVFYDIVPYKDNKFTLGVSLKKRKIKPSYEKGKISFDMKFDFQAKLMYGDKKTPYNFDDTANEAVTKALTEMLKNEISNAVEQAQKKFKCDYFDFDNEFRIKFPQEFQKMNWENEFEEAMFNIDVKVQLTRTSMMNYETNETK